MRLHIELLVAAAVKHTAQIWISRNFGLHKHHARLLRLHKGCCHSCPDCWSVINVQ